MQAPELHHYGFLTRNTAQWLHKREIFLGKPVFISETFVVASQKVKVTFVKQSLHEILIELVEPLPGNQSLERMLQKDITFYHCGYLCRNFDEQLKHWSVEGGKPLAVFHSEAFSGRRCAFVLTEDWGLLELIEEGS